MNTLVTIPKNSCSSEIISRQEILNWINSTLNFRYRRIEDLTSGGAYCLIMNILFPGIICTKKLRVDTKLEHEMLINYKALQNAFRKSGVDKEIPISNLMKGRFQDHLMFSQWFKRFHDANMNLNRPVINGNGEMDSIRTASNKLTRPCLNEFQNDWNDKTPMPICLDLNNQASIQPTPNLTNSVSPELIGLKSEYNKMKEEYEEDQQTISDLTRERQFYYEKLCSIEQLCNEYQQGPYADLVRKLQEILFKEEDGFVSPSNQECQ